MIEESEFLWTSAFKGNFQAHESTWVKNVPVNDGTCVFQVYNLIQKGSAILRRVVNKKLSHFSLKVSWDSFIQDCLVCEKFMALN